MQVYPHSGKRQATAVEGQGVVDSHNKSPSCVSCGKIEGEMLFKRCAKCKGVRYCSTVCQRKHWQQHKTLCATIAELSKTHNENPHAEEQFYKSCLSPREQSKLIRLVGRRCSVNCSLDTSTSGSEFLLAWQMRRQNSSDLWNTALQDFATTFAFHTLMMSLSLVRRSRNTWTTYIKSYNDWDSTASSWKQRRRAV